MSGRALGKIAGSYQSSVVRPMVRRIRTAASHRGLLAQLGPGLVRQMDATLVAEALTEVAATATGVGAVSAMPRETSKRRKVKTSKRQDEEAE